MCDVVLLNDVADTFCDCCTPSLCDVADRVFDVADRVCDEADRVCDVRLNDVADKVCDVAD